MTIVVKSFFKDPTAIKDYGFDWGSFLAGDTISSSSWTCEPDVLDLTSEDFDDTHTVVWVGGGVVKGRYTITNHIVTAQGREDERSLLIVVQDQ